MARIAVVIPVYNEQDCLEALFERLERLRESTDDDYEYLFVGGDTRDG